MKKRGSFPRNSMSQSSLLDRALKLIKIVLMVVISLLIVSILPLPLNARVETGVTGKGEAAVVGITPEEGQLIALQRARADAIEKSVGMQIHGTTLVTNGRLVGQFLKTFSRGFITQEEKTWSDDFIVVTQSGPRTPKYMVSIVATVHIPEKKVDRTFHLKASLNRASFVAGDCATVTAEVSKRACLAIFNLRADDKVAMIYPSEKTGATEIVELGKPLIFPGKAAGNILEMATLPNHKHDTEAFLIVAVQAAEKNSIDFNELFSEGRLYNVPEFFEIYSRIADISVEQILPYEVREREQDDRDRL